MLKRRWAKLREERGAVHRITAGKKLRSLRSLGLRHISLSNSQNNSCYILFTFQKKQMSVLVLAAKHLLPAERYAQYQPQEETARTSSGQRAKERCIAI